MSQAQASQPMLCRGMVNTRMISNIRYPAGETDSAKRDGKSDHGWHQLYLTAPPACGLSVRCGTRPCQWVMDRTVRRTLRVDATAVEGDFPGLNARRLSR